MIILAQNIDTIEIPLNGVNKQYYLPNDGRILGKIITGVETFGSELDADSEIYAQSGRQVVEKRDLQNIYLTLVAKNGAILVNNVSLQFLHFVSATHLSIDSEIDPTKSYLSVMADRNVVEGKSVLLSIYYKSQVSGCWKEPIANDRVSIPIKNETGVFYLQKQYKLTGKKIQRVEAVSFSKGVLMTLITKQGQTIKDVPLCRLGKYYNGSVISNLLYFEGMEIDYEKSYITHIINDLSPFVNPIILNFYYEY